MHPAVRKQRLKRTNTGEMRIAYSQKEAMTMIGIPYSRSQWQQWAQMIPPSIFVFQVPYYTLRQITLLKAWANGQLPRNVDLHAYVSQHWNDPDPEE